MGKKKSQVLVQNRVRVLVLACTPPQTLRSITPSLPYLKAWYVMYSFFLSVTSFTHKMKEEYLFTSYHWQGFYQQTFFSFDD